MADINRKIRQITASPYYSAAKKRELIDKLKQRQDELARRVVH